MLLTSAAWAGGAISSPRPEELRLYESSIKQSVPAHQIREQARQLLKQSPASYVAAYVYGKSELDDGNYPQALWGLGLAQKTIEKHPDYLGASHGTNIQWHAEVLRQLAAAYFNMDRNVDAVRIGDLGISLYPGRTDIFPDNYRIDSLLKLGRVNEAKGLADTRLAEAGLYPEEKAMRRIETVKILFALEPDGRRAYDECKALCIEMPALKQKPPYNDLAFHARRQGMYREAFDALTASTKFQNADSPSHPHRVLSEMAVAQGDWAQAEGNIRQMWNWLYGKKIDKRFELEGDTRLAAAGYYLATGQPERAERLIIKYVDHPIRAGFSSRPIEEWEAGVNLMCVSASRQIRALEVAAVSCSTWHRRLYVHVRHVSRVWHEQIMARRIRGLITERMRKGPPIRDALVLVNGPAWLWGDVVRILGPSRTRALMRRYPMMGEQKRMFEEALMAECAFVSRQWQDTICYGKKALEALPMEETILRARISALVGEALRHDGGVDESMSYFAQAFRSDRAVVLMTDIRLPVAGQDPLVAKSPLIRTVPEGIKIATQVSDDTLTCTIDLQDGQPNMTAKATVGSHKERPVMIYLAQKLLFSTIGIPTEALTATVDGQALSGKEEAPDRMDAMIQTMKRSN